MQPGMRAAATSVVHDTGRQGDALKRSGKSSSEGVYGGSQLRVVVMTTL
jgi:hypothetical protein